MVGGAKHQVRRTGARESAGHRRVVRRTGCGGAPSRCAPRWRPSSSGDRSGVHSVESTEWSPLDVLHPVAMRDIGWTPLGDDARHRHHSQALECRTRHTATARAAST
jgi:hypothetical protein